MGNWTTFEGQQHGIRTRDEVRVTLGHRGTFYLNGRAYAALGEPSAVEMLYDGDRRIIGLKPTDPTRRNAFRLRHHGNGGTYKRIAAASFCRHFRLRTDRTVKFENIDLDNAGVMLLDLATAINVTRSPK